MIASIEAMGDGTGTVMIEGKMQDDATFKQCKVMVNPRADAGDERPVR